MEWTDSDAGSDTWGPTTPRPPPGSLRLQHRRGSLCIGVEGLDGWSSKGTEGLGRLEPGTILERTGPTVVVMSVRWGGGADRGGRCTWVHFDDDETGVTTPKWNWVYTPTTFRRRGSSDRSVGGEGTWGRTRGRGRPLRGGRQEVYRECRRIGKV